MDGVLGFFLKKAQAFTSTCFSLSALFTSSRNLFFRCGKTNRQGRSRFQGKGSYLDRLFGLQIFHPKKGRIADLIGASSFLHGHGRWVSEISWMLLVKDGLITLTPFLQQKTPYKKSARIRNPMQASSKAGVAFVTAEVWSYLLAGFINHIWMFPKIELPPNHPF